MDRLIMCIIFAKSYASGFVNERVIGVYREPNNEIIDKILEFAFSEGDFGIMFYDEDKPYVSSIINDTRDNILSALFDSNEISNASIELDITNDEFNNTIDIFSIPMDKLNEFNYLNTNA